MAVNYDKVLSKTIYVEKINYGIVYGNKKLFL